MQNRQKLILNTATATAASLVMRFAGLAFNVFVAGRLGAAGMGLLTLIMSVYAFAVTIASSAVGTAAMKTVAEAAGHGSDAEASAVMRRCLLTALTAGCAASVLLLAVAPYAGVGWLGDARTVRPLRILAAGLPFVAMSSVLGGYFTAVRRVYKSAAAMLTEQAMRIVLTATALSLIGNKGLEYSCIAVVGGSAAAELLSFILYAALYIDDRRRHGSGGGDVPRGLTGRILRIALPIAATSYVRSALTTLEHILIPRGLRQRGNGSDAALASYGALHGMALPLIFFPSAFTSALASLTVPEIAEAGARGDRNAIKESVDRVLRITMAFSVGVAAILICFSYELGMAVYNNSEAARGIAVVSALIPVMYTDTAIDSVLKGLGEQLYCMKVNILDALISVTVVALAVPRIGITGYVAAIFISETLNTALSAAKLASRLGLRLRSFIGMIASRLALAGAACGAVRLAYEAAAPATGGAVSVTLCICAAAAFYAAFAFGGRRGSLTGDGHRM